MTEDFLGLSDTAPDKGTLSRESESESILRSIVMVEGMVEDARINENVGQLKALLTVLTAQRKLLVAARKSEGLYLDARQIAEHDRALIELVSSCSRKHLEAVERQEYDAKAAWEKLADELIAGLSDGARPNL